MKYAKRKGAFKAKNKWVAPYINITYSKVSGVLDPANIEILNFNPKASEF